MSGEGEETSQVQNATNADDSSAGLTTDSSVSDQLLYMFENLSPGEKRKTMTRLQPILASTFIEDPATETLPSSAPSTSSAQVSHTVGPQRQATNQSPTSNSIPGNNVNITSNSQGNYTVSSGSSTIVLKAGSNSVTPKLQLFSGIIPVPAGQVQFRTWQKSTTRLCKTHDLSDEEKTAMICNSLCQPALDLVQSALDATAPLDVLSLLEKAYGSVDDPRDLLNEFNATAMNHEEKASEYLSRLFLMLEELKQRKIVKSEEGAIMLLKQFNYGCQDETLMLKLRLEEKEDNPPDYGTLLLALRKEESKRTKKQQFWNSNSFPAEAPVRVSSQASIPEYRQAPSTSHKEQKRHEGSGPKKRGKKLRFCFKCGQDGHTVWSCSNDANPVLVGKRFDEAKHQENA
jgi:hypothetical protein